MTEGTVLITMAGKGSRFREAGYDQPKYEILLMEGLSFSGLSRL